MKEMLQSQRFRVAFATIISLLIAAGLGVEIPADTLAQIISGIVAVVIMSRGVSDHGKVAAKIQADVEMARIDAAKEVAALPTQPSPQP